MTKYNVSRILETSKYTATKAGQELAELIRYLSDVVENVSRIMRNGISFADNVACEIRVVAAKHNVDTVISAAKPVIGILPTRVLSSSTGLDSFAWFYDAQGQLTVKAGFTGAPADSQKVTLVLLF